MVYHQKYLDQSLKEGKGTKTVLLQDLTKETDDDLRIRDELLNLLIAGRDTIAALLSSAIWEISRKPDVWQWLKEEVKSLDGALQCMLKCRTCNI